MPDAPTINDVLTVEPREDMPGFFAVLPHECATIPRTPVATFGSAIVAWHDACWRPFHLTNTLPKITPGNWFEAPRKGYTSDPRFAVRVPAETVTPEQHKRIEAAIIRFARAKVGNLDPVEAFLPGEDTPQTLEEVPESPGPDVPGECSPTCAPHLAQHCSPECEERATTHRLPDPEDAPFCHNCPDHEACATGWSCEDTRAASRTGLNDPEGVPDGDLPGAWTHSDFLGGDPDTRSYAERDAEWRCLDCGAFGSLSDSVGHRCPKQAPGSAESEPPGLAGSEGGLVPDDPYEAVRTALSDSARNALENFEHMAETAPTEQARNFWLSMAHDVTQGAMD